jgi:FkbM family methyltransferase
LIHNFAAVTAEARAMVKTVLVNLRNFGQWMLAAATFVVRKERAVLALTPPPIVAGDRLFLFKTQRVLHRHSRRLVAARIEHAVEFYVFRNIFYSEDYSMARLAQWPDIKAAYEGIVATGGTPLIIDCGANIGLSAVYFALEFPAARIVALEPHRGNFARAVATTRDFEAVHVIQAGIASEPGSARIVDPGMSTDAYRTEMSDAGNVAMLTVADLLREAAPSMPFVVKIDIEGFESNLFAKNTQWIDDFCVLVIELHDWMLPKQSNSGNFLRAISERDRDFVHISENIFSIRNAPHAARADLPEAADIPIGSFADVGGALGGGEILKTLGNHHEA